MTPKERYNKLKEHLLEENPLLVDAIQEYQELDNIAKKIGFLKPEQTFTESISWWPLISVLGTFSAGKSSFINMLLGMKIQDTGNQAVDDKFTVICYSKNEEPMTLPGVALDADPRFPFYNISKEIDKLEPGANINRYLQLKAVKSEMLKGKILIDSPGFDADAQRDATLKITRHIIDLSDLVLIFFDARHPEPGAMRDTLDHLVSIAQDHAESEKVLYILNQIDTCAKEDNLEEIIGAWQRALSQKGLVSGRFYAIYNEELAQIEESGLRERLKRKKDQDLTQIKEKMDKVLIDRAYRIIKNIEQRAKDMLALLPTLKSKLTLYKKLVLISDLIFLIAIGAGGWYLSYLFPDQTSIIFLSGAIIFSFLHFQMRSIIRKFLYKRIDSNYLKSAFLKATKWYKPYFLSGYISKKTIRRLEELVDESKNYIQKLNDQFIALHRDKPDKEEYDKS